MRTRLVIDVSTGEQTVVPYTPEEEAEADAAAAAEVAAANDPANFPLSMRQLRVGLKMLGGKPASFLLDTINKIENPDERDLALIWYEETSEVHWDHPMTQSLISKAGFTPEQAAAMWLAAKSIPA